MGAGPSTNLYSIGGDPLTQLIFLNYIFLNLFFFFFFKRNADSDQINRKYVVGEPLTQLKLIKNCLNVWKYPKLLTDSLESLYVRWVWSQGPIYITLVVTH